MSSYSLGKYEQSLDHYYDFLDQHMDHEWAGYTVYWAAESFVQLGECGYAVTYFDVLANGGLWVPDDWAAAAQANIDVLSADNGQICTSWD